MDFFLSKCGQECIFLTCLLGQGLAHFPLPFPSLYLGLLYFSSLVGSRVLDNSLFSHLGFRSTGGLLHQRLLPRGEDKNYVGVSVRRVKKKITFDWNSFPICVLQFGVRLLPG